MLDFSLFHKGRFSRFRKCTVADAITYIEEDEPKDKDILPNALCQGKYVQDKQNYISSTRFRIPTSD
jgi:hypothetical protein